MLSCSNVNVSCTFSKIASSSSGQPSSGQYSSWTTSADVDAESVTVNALKALTKFDSLSVTVAVTLPIRL